MAEPRDSVIVGSLRSRTAVSVMEKRITVDELLFDAKLREYIDKQVAKWEAGDTQPPTKEERDNRWLWEMYIEETEWERFYGIPQQAIWGGGDE